MAFRRSNNFRRNAGNFRSRSRFRPTGTDRKAKPTQRYEWGEFFVENLDQLPDVGGAAGDTLLTYTRLATTRNIGDPGTGQGRALISAARHIDIGGIVADYQIRPSSSIIGDNVPPAYGAGIMYCMVGLIVDRVGGDTLPGSLTSWDPFESSTPTATISATTPGSDTIDVDRPTRLLWQRTWMINFIARQISNPEPGALYVPDDQRVDLRHATLNKRLRVRLDDEVGLYFVRAYRASAAFDLEENVPAANFFLRGSIYYRFGF